MIRQMEAKREYVCHVCGRKIFRGQEYIREKWREYLDGKPVGWRTEMRHIHCDAMLKLWRDQCWIDDPHELAIGVESARMMDWARLNGCMVLQCPRIKECRKERFNPALCLTCQKQVQPPAIVSAVMASIGEQDDYEALNQERGE